MSEEIKKAETKEQPIENKEEAKAAAAPAAPATTSKSTAAPEKKNDAVAKRPYQDRKDQKRGGYRQQGDARYQKFRKKVCRFCHEKDAKIDYKTAEVLERFITDRGKILPRRVTGTCAKHQRAIAREIKRARIIARLPFVEQ